MDTDMIQRAKSVKNINLKIENWNIEVLLERAH